MIAHENAQIHLLLVNHSSTAKSDVVRVLIQIKQDIDKEAERTQQLSLGAEELAFYDVIVESIANLYDQQFLCDLIRDVVHAIKKNLKVDWTEPHREDVKAGVRAAVKTVLRKRGVKPEHLETLKRKVIVQAEAMFKHGRQTCWHGDCGTKERQKRCIPKRND